MLETWSALTESAVQSAQAGTCPVAAPTSARIAQCQPAARKRRIARAHVFMATLRIFWQLKNCFWAVRWV
jgi:hypothetical protein